MTERALIDWMVSGVTLQLLQAHSHGRGRIAIRAQPCLFPS
jgi:hypothetical protein